MMRNEILSTLQERLDDSVSLFEHGKMLHGDSDYEGAIASYKDALAIQESALGLFHDDTARTYWSMAWAQYQRGNLCQALTLFQMCWRISRYLYGEDGIETLLVLDDIHDVLEDMSFDMVEIQTYCSDLLQAFEYEKNGNECCECGQHNEAVKLYLRAIKIHEMTQENVAAALARSKRQQTNNEDIESLGLESNYIYRKMAPILRARGDAEGALSLLCKALVVYQFTLGKSHPSTEATRNGARVVAQREIVTFENTNNAVPLNQGVASSVTPCGGASNDLTTTIPARRQRKLKTSILGRRQQYRSLSHASE